MNNVAKINATDLKLVEQGQRAVLAQVNTVQQRPEGTIDVITTMTSLDIAELVKSNHADVRRSMERLAERGVIALPPLAEVFNPGPGPRNISVYRVGKRDSYVIVAQLSPEFTARLVDRWQELEALSPAIPKTFAQALLLAAQQQEEIERQQAALEVAKPKVEYADALLNADDTTLVRDAAKTLGVRVRELEVALKMKGVILPNNAPAAQYVNKGYFKESIHPYKTKSRGTQIGITARVTGRGIEFIRRFVVRNISLFPKSNHRGATQ